MTLNSAGQGYIYQDILGAYFIAQELANGTGSTQFHFDYKKAPSDIPDKFDDLAIYRQEGTSYFQIKYSNDEHQHVLTKQDFSSSGNYDLALFDLFNTWQARHSPGCLWRICLAWDKPLEDDPIQDVIIQLPDSESLLPGTTCYQFDCDALWPENGQVLSGWRSLKKHSQSIDRTAFKSFLECLVLEVNCPKSTLLQDYTEGLEKLLTRTIERIGIGIYPNDHLAVRQVAESLCIITQRKRVTNDVTPINCDEIAQEVGIKQTHGGIEQKFPVDENILIATPDRLDQIISVLKEHRVVILTAEPGAGKSWFLENLQRHLQETIQVIKHYCYIALEDPLALKRITVNVLYGSLITQILQSDEDLSTHKTKRYASNLEQLNILLGKIKKKTLLIVDGIDHIWRVYQKNRGGLTEDETKILEALAQLDLSNPKISLLIVSQPIEELAVLDAFYPCTLDQLPESFIEELLDKQAIPNIEVEQISLATVIHEKSNGNALYCKYLIDHAIANKTNSSFDWVAVLPPYDFNLTSYYQYLYEQIQGDTRVPYALCGADFSVTEVELQKITHLGNFVAAQLTTLKPILRGMPAIGYSIYHESFKRFVIDTINAQGASIEHLIYRPLIAWLETHDFFESPKAYGHLLKLYYEVDALDTIAQTISVEFLDKSLYNAQPFHHISQNHHLQKASLQCDDGFAPMIMIAEQSKIIYELEHIPNEVRISYLKAVQKIKDEEAMYRVLWDEEKLLVDIPDALRFLVHRAYQRAEIVHWSIVPSLSSIPYDILGLCAVKLLHTKQYEKFDTLLKDLHKNPAYTDAFAAVFNEVEWWCIYRGDDWTKDTPNFQNILAGLIPSVSNLKQAVAHIVSNDRFIYDDEWEVTIRDIVMLAKTASAKEIETAIHALAEYNWFRNWVIYLIKISELSQRDYDGIELIDAFTYLVRDLEPFKGTPRVCDLFRQFPLIKKSFHWGLLLCNEDEKLLTQCCELLEKVTSTTTSIQREMNGPLTIEDYLEIISYYLPGEYVIDKYTEYYPFLGAKRLYSDIAQTAFEYAYILSDVGRNAEAERKYSEGIQALTAYGFRKDRTLSEILYSSVPYQQAYGTLEVEWFYDLYHMAMAVVTHTDGKETSNYPIEWFEEFIKVYPDEALKFLITATLESTEAHWYQEDPFYHVLEAHTSLFSPTQWFLLCRSLPLASSDKIITHGLTIGNEIDGMLQDAYQRWLQAHPNTQWVGGEASYSQEIVDQFKTQFGIQLQSKKENNTPDDILYTGVSSPSVSFPTSSMDDVLAFLETNSLTECHTIYFQQFFASITDCDDQNLVLRQVAKSFRYGSDAGKWVIRLFKSGSHEWLYMNVCLFVFLRDEWLDRLHYVNYLKNAYEVDPTKTMSMLKDILGNLLAESKYTSLISCNLIKALSELRVGEEMVQDILQLTFQIVKRRLPHPPNSEINPSLYQGLEELNRDEIVVALLISRLKTLTTEKTQGIIWSLTFMAQNEPQTLIKPYCWAFSTPEFLLPIHRALLLQILIEYVDQSILPDKLITQLIRNYPTGFFLEDQYIRSFVDYKIELDENAASSILQTPHHYDDGFFPYLHPKHKLLAAHFGILTGTYNAYAYQRDKISKEHKVYNIQTDRVVTPIVSLANATYEIVNNQYYDYLKELTYHYHPSYICEQQFFLTEIIIQIGALARRPLYLPNPANFPSLEIRTVSCPFEDDDWVILASTEKELYGEKYEPKKSRESSLILNSCAEPTKREDFYAVYPFKTEQFVRDVINDMPFDQPICAIDIFDTLEHSHIVYVSPFIVRELNLTIDTNLHNGFQARDEKGEKIIKLITWKENYYGSISNGTEVPRIAGAAVMIRRDYYMRILELYQKKCWFVLNQTVSDE